MSDQLSQLMGAAAGAVIPAPRPVPAALPSADGLSALMEERGATNGGDQEVWADIQRVCALPVKGPLNPAELDALTRMYSLEDAYRRGFRMFEEQARSIAAFDMVGGLLAPVPVGRGKTLIAMSLASRQFSKGVRKILILVPATNLSGFLKQAPWIRTKTPANVPLHVVAGVMKNRLRVARSNTPGAYVLPYSMLSTEDTADLLEGIEPELIIADEVQNLKWMTSGRTKRIVKYMSKHPACAFAGMSGTITNKSIRDYWHLITWALGERSPLPVSPWLAGNLASVLDSEAMPSRRQMEEWAPLRRWARVWFPAKDFDMGVVGLREAYQLRLTSAPGVVSSNSDCMVDTHLIVRNTPIPDHKQHPDWEKLDELMEQVEGMYISPTGDEIAHAIHTHKWMRELTMGFYNKLVWPEPEVLARRRNIEVGDAAELLTLARSHHEAKQDYSKELRRWFGGQHRDRLDTPRLVGQSMAQHGADEVGKKLYGYWKHMKDQELEDMPVRDRIPVRVCDYKIVQAVEWARGRDGGILWYHHQEVGLWLMSYLEAAGIEAIHCPAGYPIIESSDAEAEEFSHKLHVCSIGSHGTGKNLQHHTNQLCVEWPRGAHTVEQLLGRLHRTGQEAECLYVDTNDTSMFDVMNRAAGLVDALYQYQTTGNHSRVVFCEYDPLPMIMPPEVLRARGFENKLLNDQQKEALKERFNPGVASSET